MENHNYTTWNRTRDLPLCSAVPQQTAPPLAPCVIIYIGVLIVSSLYFVMNFMFPVADQFCRSGPHHITGLAGVAYGVRYLSGVSEVIFIHTNEKREKVGCFV